MEDGDARVAGVRRMWCFDGCSTLLTHHGNQSRSTFDEQALQRDDETTLVNKHSFEDFKVAQSLTTTANLIQHQSTVTS
jgi:hypothetical protein